MTNGSLPILSNSRLKDARACQRLHHYKYGLQYRPVDEGEALRFGSLWHKGLEAWWSTPRDDERLSAALQALCAGDSDPFDRVRAEAMMVGYDARWLSEMEHYEVIGVEVQFRAPLVNPDTGAPSRTWQLGGKVDALVLDRRTGHTQIVEHKTSSEPCGPGSDYFKRLRLDSQVSIYYRGVEALGIKPDSVLYDVALKPGLRPYKATPLESRKYKKGTGELYANQRENDETPSDYRNRLIEAIAAEPNEYFVRAELVRLEGEMVEAMADVWQTGRVLRENELRGFYPRTVEACVRWSRTCPFFPACCGEASLDDASLYRQIEDPHPELAEEAARANGSIP
jgi:hypothetical protein